MVFKENLRGDVFWLFSSPTKCLNGNPDNADKGAQCTLGDFFMIGHGKCGVMILFDQDDMAASLSNHLPPKGLKDFHDFTATERRQAWH